MKHLFKISVALLLAALGCLSVSRLDGYGRIVAFAFAGLCLLVISVTFGCAGGNALRRKPSGKGVVMVLAAFCVGWLVGLGINQSRIDRAKAFATHAVPIILEYQKAHPELEELPERLDEIPNMPPLPDLMAPRFNIAEESGVRLTIINPYDYSKNWAYSSKTGKWIGFGL